MRIDTTSQFWTRHDGQWVAMMPEPAIVRDTIVGELLDLVAGGQAVDVVIDELLRRWDDVECRRCHGGGWEIKLHDRLSGDWHEIDGDTLGDCLSTALEVRR